MAVGPQALWRAAETVVAGRVVAMKGLGGFQLLVDATNPQAVARLRQRKRRPDRPLAVMLPTLDDVPPLLRSLRRGSPRAGLGPSADPAVAASRRCRQPADRRRGVAPGNPYLGVMLPYTPLHHLLMAAVGRPIVCTSGNLSEEPMAITTRGRPGAARPASPTCC